MAYSATLEWRDPPACRADGTPTGNFLVNIFDGTQPRMLIAAVPPGTEKFITGTLRAGVHDFSLVVVDSDGAESAVTRISVTVPR